MKRRDFLVAAMVVAASPAAAGWAKRPFASDRISVMAEGEGPDVILIPGMTSSPDAWKLAPATPPGYRYHYVQVKGFAGIPVEGNASGSLLAGVTGEIARYIREAGLRKPAIVGHSMGGTIALMLAARHPDLSSRVMVVDQVPFMGIFFGPPGTTAESVTPIADMTKARLDASSEADRVKAMTAMTGSMVANEALRPNVIAQAIASDRRLTAATFRELIVTDLRPELAKIGVPATILYVTPAGTKLTDAQVDATYEASYATLKGAKLVRIPDSAHFIMYDNPQRFRAELETFLKG